MNETIESNVWPETTLAIFFFLVTDTDLINETLITSFVSRLGKCVYLREITCFNQRRILRGGNCFLKGGS